MEDPERGGSPSKSEASGTGKPHKSGNSRRRWWKKKASNANGPQGQKVAYSGAGNSDQKPGCTVAGLQKGHATQHKAGENTTVDSAQEHTPKKTRRRRRRRKKNPYSGEPVVASMEQRHRRQPMQAEAPASFSKERGDNSGPPNNQHKQPIATGSSGKKPPKKPRSPYYHKNQRTFYAALDLGTNNCRLLVALPQASGRFRVVDAFSRIVRLGEGLAASGKLGEAAMERTIGALQDCSEKLQLRSKTRFRLIATEACRRAENGQNFLDRVRDETGLNLEIVDRATEARLAVSGCGSLVDHNADGVVLFDIGGGSSELALLDVSKKRSRRISDHITAWESLPLGVVTLSEKFGGRHVTPAVFEDMVIDVSELLEKFEGRHALSRSVGSNRFHLLGTSGTVTTLAGVHLNLKRYDRRRVDGAWLSNKEVDAMINRILHMSFDDRVNNPCIGADRADLVLAGCAILEAIRRHWPSPRLRVADRGLREGLLTEMMAEDGVWRRKRRRSGNRHGYRPANQKSDGNAQ